MLGLAALALTFAIWGCGGDGGGGDDDGAVDTDTDSDTDTDGDSDSDTDPDGGTDSDSETEDPCDGECASLTYTTCTCRIDDPCDWAEDGYCDGLCFEAQIVEEMFDDTVDCPGECSGLCLEVEWAIHYLPCTCDVDDPCEWAGNGICDSDCLELDVVEEMFDDSLDCDGDAGVDGG
jgi:hypothetical protein